MTTRAIRPWCAKVVFPGLKPFLLGTIVLDANAQHHEIEAALVAAASEILPQGFQIIEPICGALFFLPDETP